MTDGRYVVLGLAVARSPWFRSVAQWANSASIPVEFVKCVSVTELRAHLRSGRPYSALLVDGGVHGFDRDLIEDARAQSCAVLVVDDVRVTHDWIGLGASAVINPMFQRDDLLEVLDQRAARITAADAVPGDPFADTDDRGRVEGAEGGGRPLAAVAMVCGPGGTGASTVAAALAQGLCDDLRFGRMVLLADLRLQAEQAMLHDVRDVVPGVQELVEVHRAGRPPLEDLRRFTFDIDERGYQLLLGLRRSREWPTLRPRAFAAAIDSVARGWRALVCDTDADLEGEEEGGSTEVEDRHLMARTIAARADVAFVVGRPGMKGVHSLVRVLGELLDHGVPAERVVPVFNLAPKAGRPRADLARAVATLLEGKAGAATMPTPLFLPERPVDDALRDGVRLPPALAGPLAGAFVAVADRAGARRLTTGPQPITPGSLGGWSPVGAEPR